MGFYSTETSDISRYVPDLVAVEKLLNTPYGEVYETGVCDGQLFYTRPASLFGTPVDKIEEASTYWNPDWHSLDAYLAREAEENKLKAESRARLEAFPDNKAIRKEAKLHSDNMSKQVKIRDNFKEKNYHPNQVVSKRYLSPHGLCDQEAMYKLACLVSHFEFLAKTGKLAMDPFDFVRWRVGGLVLKQKRTKLPGAESDVRGIVIAIAAEDSEDKLFRQALLYSAILSGNIKRFKGDAQTKPRSTRPSNNNRLTSPVKGMFIWRELRHQRPRAQEQQQRQAQQMRRAAHQPQKGGYAGVNNFRMQQGNGQ